MNLETNLPVIENSEIGKGVKYTIFAPSDQAFGNVGSLDPGTVNNLLRYHIIPIEAMSSDFNKIQYQPTLFGTPDLVKLGIPNAKQKLIIKNDNGVITVGNGNIIGKVVSADNIASNGVIHVIDSIILLPDSPMNVMNNIIDLNYFRQVITGANLANTFNDFVGVTIFAPSNDAISQAPKELLSTSNLTQLTNFINYHVVPRVIFSGVIIGTTFNQESEQGSTLTISNDGNIFSVNGVEVITPDILLNDGVLHIIGEYIVAPGIPNYIPTPTNNSIPPTLPTISTIPSTSPISFQLSSNKDIIIISSVLGGIIGMAAIGIGLTLFFCRKQKGRETIFKTYSVTNSHISSDHAPTNFTQRSDDMSHLYSSTHGIFDRNYTNNEPINIIGVHSRNSNEESNISGSDRKISSNNIPSENSSVYFSEEIPGVPASYNANPSNTNSVRSNSSNHNYSPNPNPYNPAHLVHSPNAAYTVNNNMRNTIINTYSSNYYSPHGFPSHH
ncbi:hypothetical protein RclHR1_01330032 [Rhizophagus clarus]|uniref:Fasciclin domain-containing protein n=1 Tax=Rhizophagus clarus TaxID=94130 RepID=A0A2Z6R231_9GLOM|nr:hypothetical protein RclHR1_01330032 [Rhizophagus clarus]GES79865.1 fasciclin domain-containing protein [Rhizophagus clarus]